jgi:hypothetical protein
MTNLHEAKLEDTKAKNIFDNLDELAAPITPLIQVFGNSGIAIRKPGKTEWIMASASHQPKAFWIFTDETTSRMYLLMPVVASDPIVAKVCRQTLLFVCINRTGEVFVSPVGTSDNDYATTSRTIHMNAQREWMRMVANQKAGKYESYTSEFTDKPTFPTTPYNEILQTAFGAHGVIDSVGHELIRNLNGKV